MNGTASAPSHLSGMQRSAGLLIALGPEVSGKVLAHFREHEIERLTWELTNLGPLSLETCDQLVEEAYNAVVALDFGPQGGLDYALEVLEHALGRDKAQEVGDRLRATIEDVPFAFVQDLEATQVAAFLVAEHPQTGAVVLSYVPASHGAAVLALLPPHTRVDVAMRMAHMERTAPEVVKEIESQMRRKLSGALSLRRGMTQTGGVESLVKLLKGADRATEHEILDALAKVDPELVEAIKQQMFVFDNIVQLDDRSVQRVLRDVDPRDLTVALKGASIAVKQLILRNMSSRASAMLDEDLAAMGPVRVSTVEAAQGNIVNVIRKLDEAEEIVISRGGDVLG